MKNLRIVIVDDSPFSISILKDILLDNEFDVVGEAGSLDETIAVVTETKPDLVTMDMTLPGTDGLECTRAIHEIDENIKVIIVSSMMDEEIIQKAKRAKVAGYVQKPVDADELVTAIKRVTAGNELFNELKDTYFTVFKEAISDAINRFVKASTAFGEDIKDNEIEASRGISVVMGIIGKYSGSVILDTSYETAESLAERILKRKVKNREEVLAALGEFTNIIAGNACSILNRKNKILGLRVAPPTIFHGSSINICKTISESTAAVANIEFGEIYLNVGFKRGDDSWI
ncbi:Chemotaxis phosphatase CheX [Clostridium cavendishii DSM 21758]|uniref:Stage 0 sporulation protein A homolog n=1 Tax=Clostridium cavendishii DSM 21758 TaxID=1121302 RepID=A0A1M6ECC5_9CLOT|nr:response regulator [Clostridium cavendishii]SHI83124.1 Chemotaxis phosphatase CheX [Clostridium cavendishii DSM 21758]